MHDEGEIDVRACYTAISVSWLSLYLSFFAYMLMSRYVYVPQTLVFKDQHHA